MVDRCGGRRVEEGVCGWLWLGWGSRHNISALQQYKRNIFVNEMEMRSIFLFYVYFYLERYKLY